MIGGFQFRLNSNKLQYDFVVNRKITKIIGDSATGKSELVTTVATKDDAAMNIHITCKYTDSFFVISCRAKMASLPILLKNRGSEKVSVPNGFEMYGEWF